MSLAIRKKSERTAALIREEGEKKKNKLRSPSVKKKTSFSRKKRNLLVCHPEKSKDLNDRPTGKETRLEKKKKSKTPTAPDPGGGSRREKFSGGGKQKPF